MALTIFAAAYIIAAAINPEYTQSMPTVIVVAVIAAYASIYDRTTRKERTS